MDKLEDVRQKLAKLGRSNLFFFVRGILGYDKLTMTLHRELCSVVEHPAYSKKLIIIPRGMYKTTIANIGRALHRIVQDPNCRIIIACNTYNLARTRLRRIKGHIEGNPVFRWLYPEVIPDFGKTTWSADEIVVKRTTNAADPTIRIAGVGTALTGAHCTDFIKDDIVDDKNSRTPELIEQVVEWDATTVPIFDEPESGGMQEIVIGTPWANTDLYAIKGDDPEYATYMRHALEDANGKPDFTGGLPIFPERYPRERLERIRKRVSNDDLFFCQYMCDPHGGENATFKREWLQYWDILPSPLEYSVTIDPGGYEGRSDYTGITVVGVDVNGMWYVVETIKMRLNPREIIEQVFRLNTQYKPHTIGIEPVAYQRSLIYFAREEMQRRNAYVPLLPLTVDTRVSKEMRIRGLVPRFSNGGIFLNRKVAKDLEDELFERVANDDLKDALAYQLQVANRTPEVFTTMVEDPFSIESILKELAGQHGHVAAALKTHLADEYVEAMIFGKQIKEANA